MWPAQLNYQFVKGTWLLRETWLSACIFAQATILLEVHSNVNKTCLWMRWRNRGGNRRIELCSWAYIPGDSSAVCMCWILRDAARRGTGTGAERRWVPGHWGCFLSRRVSPQHWTLYPALRALGRRSQPQATGPAGGDKPSANKVEYS
jgi:hypothetical protein